jgi:hypothetical protein
MCISSNTWIIASTSVKMKIRDKNKRERGESLVLIVKCLRAGSHHKTK